MGAVDNILGTNIFGENSTDKAMDAQKKGTNQANQVLSTEYANQQAATSPYRQYGSAATGSLAKNDFMNGWQQDPGYQFQLEEGNRAINAAASARGLGNSGATMKALAGYSQNLASQEYGKVYDRNYNRLSQLAGIGQQANSQYLNSSQNYGNTISGNYTGLGNAQASANIAQANQQSNLAGQAVGAAGLAFSDERLKKDITPVNKRDLVEMRKELKAFAFKYKNEIHGKGEWVGVMAQDLEKSKLGKTLVFENEKGEKQIHVGKAISLFLATLAEG